EHDTGHSRIHIHENALILKKYHRLGRMDCLCLRLGTSMVDRMLVFVSENQDQISTKNESEVALAQGRTGVNDTREHVQELERECEYEIKTPSKVTDFRPIACCNVLYKCISKIITERMKVGLGKVVGLNQSAFVHNRHIQDNIVLSQELLRGYERKDGPRRIAMKIDIQKAYDTVNWQFLEAILKGFGFHSNMVNWIIKYVSTASFSMCVNGERFGYFKGGRGLRQGDLMSPYLFILVMEILTLIVEKRIEGRSEFKYHFGCKEMKLTHVCLVDDLLMFCHGDMSSVMVLKEAIEEFGSMSGLLPNYSKSTIIFGCITVINEINKVLKGFLWNHGDLSKGKAKWPTEWVGKYPQLSLQSNIMLDNQCDAIIWRSKKGKESAFTVKQAYEDLKSQREDVQWSRLVCYLIWQERNFRIFRDERRSSKELVEVFSEMIRMKLLSLKVKKTNAVLNAQRKWNTFSGLVTNILESSRYDCTHFLLFSAQLGLRR
ncbi:RNA-directed DNA polymerase, eukaryota, reverse transcriptase zinc-binding domain protein, partial [Tanacetum coccineum]